LRECPDDNPKTIEVKFRGGILEDDIILLCNDCSSRHPFDKQIISTRPINEFLEKGKERGKRKPEPLPKV